MKSEAIYSILKELNALKNKKIAGIVIAAAASLAWLTAVYFNTSTLYDFFMCNFVVVSIAAFWYLMNSLLKKGIINVYIMLFCVTIGMYLWYYLDNLFFDRPLGHYVWIGGIIPMYYGWYKEYKAKFTLKKSIIFIIAAVVSVYGMLIVFDDRLSGVSKTEKTITRYLTKDKDYDKKDFEDIYYQSRGYQNMKSIYVRFKDEPDAVYIYTAIDRRAVQIAVDGPQNHTRYMHIENGSVRILNRNQ